MPRTTPINGLKKATFLGVSESRKGPPLMKVGQIGPTFIFPGKTVTFLLVESLVTSSILKMRKSHKKLAPVYAYSHAYTQIRDRGG